MAKELQNIDAMILLKLRSKLRSFRKKPSKPQITDREYIEDETGEEIGHIDDTDYPDKAERPLPHMPESHSETAGSRKKSAA